MDMHASNATATTKQLTSGISRKNCALRDESMKERVFSVSDFAYPVSTPVRGRRALIINISSFYQTHLDRTGSEFDTKTLNQLFKYLEFDVEILTDCSSIVDALKQEIKITEHRSYEVFVMIIMSHGRKNTVMNASGKSESISDLMQLMESHNFPQMDGKPKVILVDSCRSSDEELSNLSMAGRSTGLKYRKSNFSKDNSMQSMSELTKSSDILLVLSCYEGESSYRYTSSGSWFVNALNKVFMEHVDHMDILELITQVNNQVKQTNIAHADKVGSLTAVQTPTIQICTLRKKLYFVHPVGFSCLLNRQIPAMLIDYNGQLLNSQPTHSTTDIHSPVTNSMQYDDETEVSEITLNLDYNDQPAHSVNRQPWRICVRPTSATQTEKRFIISNSESIYRISSPERGFCLVIANGCSNRHREWYYSVEKISELFSKLQFKTSRRDDVKSIVKCVLSALKDEPIESYGAFVLVYLGFGTVKKCLSDLVHGLEQFPETANKPKLLVIQVCKENKCHTEKKLISGDQCKESLIPDLLVVHAYYACSAYRYEGSLFIKTLIETFAERACEQNLYQLLKEVSDTLNWYSAANSRKTQTLPTIHPTLRKKFYLFPGMP